MIEVYNVGQGDSFLLKPNNSCSFSANPILIDCGCENKNVYRKIHHTLDRVLITHSDNDHIGGLANVIINKNIKNLYVPYYLPEIIAILNYFEKKSNRKTNPLSVSLTNNINIHMLKEGDKLCSHIDILNPVVDHAIFKNISVTNQDLKIAIDTLNQNLSVSLNEDEIIEYKSDVLQYLDTNERAEYQENSKLFVHKFIYSLSLMVLKNSFKNFHQSYPISNIKKKIKYDANKYSIILKYQDRNFSYLFTGDADTTVFNRIIKDGKYNLKSDILKVPHHGSINNLNKKIISIIDPKYAIISHDNYKHNSKYIHPSENIIFELENIGATVYLTNDILKSITKIKSTKKTVGKILGGEVEFI